MIKVSGATVSVEGKTVTLTAKAGATQVVLYPTTVDGKVVEFSNRVNTKISKAGACYAKSNGSCTMTVDGESYNVVFAF